ncbi:MAG: hypothetical protein ABIJ39_03360 [Chloroflexota bacterium]
MEPNQLPQDIRRIIVKEIERWQKEEKITSALAVLLRKSYDFDFQPPAVAPPVPTPVQSYPPPVPKPRLTLAQTLLSETSIKIALYLGAFFVIAAALILAALVAVLRLPILLTVTVLFAGGALALKRRLPQPSFILYLVFSTLLLITAGVLADLLNLTGKATTGYWFAVLAGMALLWAFSTRLYASRLFSLAALLALDAALVTAGYLLDQQPLELFLLLLTISSLAGLAGAFLLKRWQGPRLATPIFILAQIQQALIVSVAFFLVMIDAVTAAHDWGLLSASTWLFSAVFAATSNLLFPFGLYPWIAALALTPVAWLAVVRSDSGLDISALTLSFWGLLYTVGGEFIQRSRERLHSYVLPLSLTAVPLLLLGASIGLTHDRWLGFGLFLGTATLLSISHALRKRAWVWVVALGSSLVAYFTFFQLPFTGPVSEQLCSQMAVATLLLLLPDMLLPAGKPLPAWRWPLRGWAMLTGLAALISGILFYFFGTATEARIALFTLGGLGVLYLAYAIRMRRPVIGILFTLHTTLALVFGLAAYEVRAWLPVLGLLAGLFYGSGILLQRKNLPAWSNVLRWSGLALAAIISLAAFGYDGNDRSIYVFILACLFLAETFRSPWLEVAPPLVYSLALMMALSDAQVEPYAYYSAGIAFIFLGLDLSYTRLMRRTDAKMVTRGLGGFSALATPIFVSIPEFEATVGLFVCAGLAAFFVLQTRVYRRAHLGYAATAFFTLAVLYTNLRFVEGRWLWAMIVTAMAFFGLSFLTGRLKQPGWDSVLRNSGLILASLTGFSAPFERSGLIASLPVAITASLWAVEAFRRRNIWLGFPANGFYLMAYFMILATVQVDQPQFYSVGAASLGMAMHYLLVRAGSKTGAFLTGMLSQLILIGTSYIQFVSTEDISYFVVMFLQSLAVLVYGIVVRSRSLVITPIVLVILGVVTVIFGALRGISTVILIGCTGIGLILLGIAALLLRERITSLRDQLKDWHA